MLRVEVGDDMWMLYTLLLLLLPLLERECIAALSFEDFDAGLFM